MPTSEKYSAFDVVVIPFPYADRLAEKRRPALVISSEELDDFSLLWVAMITAAENKPWSCDVRIDNFEKVGLPILSVVRPAKIACIDPGRIIRRAGSLDRNTAQKVASRLRAFLA